MHCKKAYKLHWTCLDFSFMLMSCLFLKASKGKGHCVTLMYNAHIFKTFMKDHESGCWHSSNSGLLSDLRAPQCEWQLPRASTLRHLNSELANYRRECQGRGCWYGEGQSCKGWPEFVQCPAYLLFVLLKGKF